ncbi:hypothetical protein ONZ51_g594 [Trametes cubensis]|uniref:Uncharacterized protein n=1 Tax=Trametes cubensis TaxID=1111947 RepID=A0AAD7XGM5_9APHY|nr:hypothetical protein ONZ51_g594 [Trametes cubensis]
MPPTSTVDSPSRLNSPNLRKLSSLRVSKHTRLHSFIRSQETYLASYAQEGKSATASWNSPIAPTGTPKKSLQNVEIESGFGTPVLKPRVDLKPPVPTAEAPIVSEGEGSAEHSENLGARVKARTVKARKEADSSNKSQPIRERNTSSHNKVVSSTHDKSKDQSSKNLVSKRAHSSKLKNSEVNEDHRARLAERRERRRVKKAIVDPKIIRVESDSGDDNEDRGRAKARKASTKTAKSKGLRMPAGLALMHGFSATNIGKNRLTVGPNPVVGVFSKGRASAKASVRKGKAAKLFSEERFLGRDEKELRQSDNSTDSSTGSQVPADEGDIALQERVGPRHKSTKEKTKRVRAKAISDPTTDDAEPDCSNHQTPRSPVKKRARVESPIWDIELGDGRLPSDNESEASDLSKDTRISGTIVLDTRMAKPEWAIAMSPHKISAVGPLKTNQELIRSDVSETSITPSHSASQAAPHRSHTLLDMPPVAAFSKYFVLPPRPRSAVSCPVSGSPPQMNSPVSGQQYGLHHSEESMPRLELESKSGFMAFGAVLEDPIASLSDMSPKQILAALPPRACPQTAGSPLGLSPGLSSPAASMPASHAALESPRQRRRYWHGDLEPGTSVIEPFAVTRDGAFAYPDHATMHPHCDEATVLGHDIHTLAFLEQEDAVYPVQSTSSDSFYVPRADVLLRQPGSATQYSDRRSMFAEDHFDPGGSLYAEYDNPGEVWGDEELDGNAYLGVEDDDRVWGQGDAEGDGGEEAEAFHCPRSTICDPEAAALSPASEDVATATDLNDDLASESESGRDQSVLGSLPRFSQGRALLMGVMEIETGASIGRSRVSRAEEDVARSLRGHWQPQRF